MVVGDDGGLDGVEVVDRDSHVAGVPDLDGVGLPVVMEQERTLSRIAELARASTAEREATGAAKDAERSDKHSDKLAQEGRPARHECRTARPGCHRAAATPSFRSVALSGRVGRDEASVTGWRAWLG